MKKTYVSPFIKVREIIEETGICFTSNGDGTETENTDDNKNDPVDDPNDVLGKGNAWNTWSSDEEE